MHPFYEYEALDMEGLPRKKLTSRDEEGTSRDDSLIDKLIYSAIIQTVLVCYYVGQHSAQFF